MKAILIRGDLTKINPDYDPQAARIAEAAGKRYLVPPSVAADPGEQIEHPDAWRLVRCGLAIPGDDECAEACGMTPEEMRAVQQAYERVHRGIHPEDYEAFDAGLMDGYDDSGRPTLRGKPVDLHRQYAPLADDDEDED